MLLHFKGQLMFGVGRCVRRDVSTHFIYVCIYFYFGVFSCSLFTWHPRIKLGIFTASSQPKDCLNPEDGGIKLLRNVDIYSSVVSASYFKRRQTSSTLLSEIQISHCEL